MHKKFFRIFQFAFGTRLLEVYGQTWVKPKLKLTILKINKLKDTEMWKIDWCETRHAFAWHQFSTICLWYLCQDESQFYITILVFISFRFCKLKKCTISGVIKEPSQSWTTRARLDKKLIHVCLFINKSSLSLNFWLV